MYMVRNTFISYNSEQVFLPEFLWSDFCILETTIFFEGLLLSLILLYTFFMVKSEALASHVLYLQWPGVLKIPVGKLSSQFCIYIYAVGWNYVAL